MDYLTQIGCLLLMLIASGDGAQEYTINPMYARTFGLINLLTTPKVTRSEFTDLTRRVSTLESYYGTLRSDVNGLRSELTTLQSQVNAIAKARCPTGSRMLSGYPFCYRVFSTPLTISAARAACAEGYGTLAEPVFSQSAAFYNAIKTAFPTEISLIGGTGKIWIGLVRKMGEVIFHYISNDIEIYNPLEVFDSSAPGDDGFRNYAVFTSPGTSTWAVEPSNSPYRYAYICQYNVIY